MARKKKERGPEIGRRLRMARTEAQLTVRQLAIRAKLAYQTIVKIEAGGGASSSVSTLGDLAEALRVNPGWLAYGNETQQKF